MTTIYGYGCSFMFGLIKKPKNYVGRTGNLEQVEPFLEIIAKDLGVKFIQRGKPGFSNEDIEKLIKKDEDKHNLDDLVFILWTGLHRNTINRLHSNSYDALNASLKAMNSAVTYLKKRNINFIMSSAFQDFKYFEDFKIEDNSFRQNFIEYDAKNNSMFDIVTNRFRAVDYDTQSLRIFDWHYNCYDGPANFEKYLKHPMIAKCLHPNQDGHDYAAEFYKPYIKERIEQMKVNNVKE